MQHTLCIWVCSGVLEFVTRTSCQSPETVRSNFDPNARIPHVTLLAASQFSFNINHMPVESICWPLLIRTRATQCPRSKGDSPICALLIDGHALHFIYFKARNQPAAGARGSRRSIVLIEFEAAAARRGPAGCRDAVRDAAAALPCWPTCGRDLEWPQQPQCRCIARLIDWLWVDHLLQSARPPNLFWCRGRANFWKSLALENWRARD